MDGDEPEGSARLRALREVPLFEDLTDPELQLLAERSPEVRAGAHHTLFREGDAADGLYVIESGTVAIVRGRQGEAVQRLARLGPGGFFGEMGLLDGAARTADAVTSVPSVLVHVRRQDLLGLFQERPLLAVKLRAAVIRRHGENVASAVQLSGRRELRTRVDSDVELQLDGGARLPARVENLSPGGACLRGLPEAWQKGREVRFALALPGQEPLLSVAGRIAWRNRRAAGIAFHRPSGAPDHEAEVRRALRRLLDDEA
ncbi:MAG: cyclic nucleotide-binding domain-containing protein [Thermoanaerobaculia bacterium]